MVKQILGGLAALGAGAWLLLVLLLRSVRPSRQTVNRSIRRHTREQVNRRLEAKLGPARYRLYGVVGDQLDQKSGWLKGLDVYLGTLDAHPELVVDYLIETHGPEVVRELVRRRTEERQ